MTHPFCIGGQVAYVVRDMEQALKYWTEYLRAGPFFSLVMAPLKPKIPRGVSNVDVSIALGNSGNLQIELIYCENGAPSVFSRRGQSRCSSPWDHAENVHREFVARAF